MFELEVMIHSSYNTAQNPETRPVRSCQKLYYRELCHNPPIATGSVTHLPPFLVHDWQAAGVYISSPDHISSFYTNAYRPFFGRNCHWHYAVPRDNGEIHHKRVILYSPTSMHTIHHCDITARDLFA